MGTAKGDTFAMNRWLWALVVLAAGAAGILVPRVIRPLLVERQVRRNIGRATRVTISQPLPSGGTEGRRSWEISDPAAVDHFSSLLLEHVRRGYRVDRDKCFEGVDEAEGGQAWPTVSFAYGTDEGSEDILLPLGDCQVWPRRLPWGWSGSGTTFAGEIHRLTGPPHGEVTGLLGKKEEQGWEVMPVADYVVDAWLPSGESAAPGCHPGYVEGDFNGDGFMDCAAILRKGDRVRRLIVHGPAESAKSFAVYESEYGLGTQGGLDGYSIFVRLREPGTVTYVAASGERETFDLERDGVEVVFAGKASALLWWNGADYSSVATSD